MFHQICVRFLLTLMAIIALVKANRSSCSSESTSTETSSDSNDGVNITETWVWLEGPVNSSESDNETVLWNKMTPAVRKRGNLNDKEETNWCMHVGAPFEEMNISTFQLTSKCCKEHLRSVLVEINNKLRYKCTDEIQFYNCLRAVNSSMSRFLGNHYFNKVPPTCYQIEEEDYCFKTICESVILKITNNTLPRF